MPVLVAARKAWMAWTGPARTTERVRVSVLASVLLLGFLPAAQTQTYPTQPIRLLVPFAPGGGMESAVRNVMGSVSASGWPQIIVDNRPGGAGTIAALATRAAP